MPEENKIVLITGGTGMIGRRLAESLSDDGYHVRILSRSGEEHFRWDPEERYIDPKAFENLYAIVHLAGAPISKRWTASYKKEIRESRVRTADLLFEYAQNSAQPPAVFLTASGINYYGTLTTDRIFTENDPPAGDFLGELGREWEKAAARFTSLGTRVCAVRTPVVLAHEGGMLRALLPMAKWYLISPLGKGRQIVPWIHIDDLVGIYQFLLEHETLSGPFNAAALEETSNAGLARTLAKKANRAVILPPVPKWALKMMLGEMSALLLEGFPVSSQKLRRAGFRFRYDDLESALEDLLR